MEKNVQRNLGAQASVLIRLGSIISSGWLSGAGHAAKAAGPATIFTWIISAIVVLAIALTYPEPGTTFPESGGMTRYAHYSHGSLVGLVAAWANWIAIVTVISIEVEVPIQYMSSQPQPWAQSLFQYSEPAPPGFVLLVVLVVVYFLLNYWSVRVFAKASSAITILKFIIPAATVVAPVTAGFHSDNFGTGADTNVAGQRFAPYGRSTAPIAITTSGTVFVFNGFQSPISLADETHNPDRNVPTTVIGSTLLAAVIYATLQVALLGAVSPKLLVSGWRSIDYHSPSVRLVIALDLNWLAIALYIGAFVSPLGTSSTYVATTTRMIYAMERNNTMPAIFGRVYPLFGVSRPAVWSNLTTLFIFLFFFRSWSALATVVSVATVISYLMGPVSVMSLCRTPPQLYRPLRLPGLSLIMPFMFVCASLILYWAKWPLTGEIIVLMLVTLPAHSHYQAKAGWPDFKTELKDAWWMIACLPTIVALSYCGSMKSGDHGYIPYGQDMGIVAMFPLFFYHWGVVSDQHTYYLDEVDSVHEETEARDRKRSTHEAPQGV